MVEVRQLRRERTRIGPDDADVLRPEDPEVLLQLARAPFVDLDRHDLSGKLRRLAAGCCTEVERSFPLACADGEARELRRPALRPDAPLDEGALVDA